MCIGDEYGLPREANDVLEIRIILATAHASACYRDVSSARLTLCGMTLADSHSGSHVLFPELLPRDDSQEVQPSAVVNKNGRTLRGFSTGAKAKMWDGCLGCPYTHYSLFYEYYGNFNYGDMCDSAGPPFAPSLLVHTHGRCVDRKRCRAPHAGG